MLDRAKMTLVNDTVPVLEQHGEALTCHFYQRMFENNPEVRPFFNPAHQRAGSQQRALAGAICAYARHIEDPSVLMDAVELIAQKHVSLGVQPEHYPVVGNNLLGSIREVMGEAATDELVEAWGEAYGVLADVFIARESEIYDAQAAHHGWQGFREFRITRREPESSQITSLYLEPTDGTPLAAHMGGQYITLRATPPGAMTLMRNYSLSNAPGAEHYRISVKREDAPGEGLPGGVCSNFVYDRLQVGDTLEIGPPCGQFTLDLPDDVTRPLVFVAGGVGVTPLLSMLHAALAADDKRPVIFIQCAVDGDARPFAAELADLESRHPNLTLHVRFSAPIESDRAQRHHHSEGFVDDALLDTLVGDASASWWFCGPTPMLALMTRLLHKRGIPPEDMHYEFFGPASAL